MFWEKDGVLGHTETNSSYYWCAWFLEIAAYCAVNCFALISGYVMHKSKPKISKLIELWLQIAFYAIGLTTIMFVIFPQTRSINNIINALFPITKRQYWYLSSYFAMYLFIPILNLGINKLEKKNLKNIIVTTFFMMSVLPTLLKSDPYMFSGGYSTAWLSVLYLIGGYIEKYDVPKRTKKRWVILTYFISILFTFLSKIVIVYVSKIIFGSNKSGEILISYTSPTIVLAGISLFVFCTKLNFKENIQKIIKLLSTATLGVYIIHEQKLIVNQLINGFAIKFINYNCFIMILKVIGSAVIIYVICTIIEIFRIKLFKLLKVKQLCSKIDKIEFFEQIF